MKTKRNKSPKKSASQHVSPGIHDQRKRKTLRLLRNMAIAAPVVGVAGFFAFKSASAAKAEADLTQIGNGVPAIVQIHDPACQLCAALQNQTRRALKSHEKGSVRFFVADIKTPEGNAFAARYRVPHVTLLLFDKRGEVKQVVRGPIDQDALENIIKAHLKRFG